MTVSVQTPIKAHTANGVTTLFAFPFKVLEADTLLVYVGGALQTTGYTVAGLGVETGGSVTFALPPANGESVQLLRLSPLERATIFSDDLRAEVLNLDFDRLWLALQELASGARLVSSAIRVPDGETINELPAADVRANRVLTFDATGGPIATPVGNLVGAVEHTVVATAGQTVFNTPTTFVPGSGSVRAYGDGLRLRPEVDFTEGSGGTSITLTEACVGGEEITIETGIATPGGVPASSVGYTAFGGVARSQAEVNADEINVFDYMTAAQRADVTSYTGALDVSDALIAAYAQAAATGRKCHEPAGRYRSTKPLTITKGVTIEGDGTSPYDGALGTVGKGTWHHFDHAGKGFSIVGFGSSLQSTVTLRNLGTIRTQPTPAPGWAPTIYDFDVYIDNFDVHLDDVMLLCPSHGVQAVNGAAGRLRTTNLRGQPFVVGIDIVTAYDAPMLVNTHFWPFWRDNTNVHAYTMANLDVLKLGRVDNPFISNWFCIFSRSGWRFYQTAAGCTSKLRAVNVDMDRGGLGIWVDNTVTNGVTAQIENFTHQGETGLSGSRALVIDGTNSDLVFGSFDTQLCNTHAIDINATGNRVRVQTFTAANYNAAGATNAAIDVASGSLVYLGLIPKIINGGSGAKYAGSGLVFVDEWRTYTPSATASSGSITTLGTRSGLYRLCNDTCSYVANVTITTNGTAAGQLLIGTPVGQAAATPTTVGVGRETAVTGDMVTATLSAASGEAAVVFADGSYPGGDGRTVCISGTFPV